MALSKLKEQQNRNLKIETEYHRAAPRGIGNAKAIGNYSASLYPLTMAKKQGFDEVIYLDMTFEEASKFNIPGDLGARIHRRVGDCYSRKGEYLKAIEEFHKGMDRAGEPVLLARINYLDGLAKINSGKLENAKEAFSGIVKIIDSDGPDLDRIKDCVNWMSFKSAVGQSELVEADILLRRARENSSSLFPYFLLGMAQERITCLLYTSDAADE